MKDQLHRTSETLLVLDSRYSKETYQANNAVMMLLRANPHCSNYPLFLSPLLSNSPFTTNYMKSAPKLISLQFSAFCGSIYNLMFSNHEFQTAETKKKRPLSICSYFTGHDQRSTERKLQMYEYAENGD